MKYTKLGKSELNVSRIALGTWVIGGGNWGKHDEAKSIDAIETAIDGGVNFIDTAPAYGDGHAEEIIGKIIRDKRDKVIIATKCGLDIENKMRINLSPEFIEYDLAQSLKRLKTDYIDLYQCHWPDPNVPIEQTMDSLVNFQQEGRIRYIGVSNFSHDQIKESIQYADIITLQSQYSLLDRTIEEDIAGICSENNIAIITYGSIGAGLLTGKYKEMPKFSPMDARSFFYGFFQQKYWHKVKALVEKMEEIARDENIKPSHIAIAWLLSKRGIAAAIVGARTSEQAKENILSTEIGLTEKEIGVLDELSLAVYE